MNTQTSQTIRPNFKETSAGIQGKKIIIGILVIVILAGGWWIWQSFQVSKKVIITTDKTEYESGENPKIAIDNKLGDTICFSSCYPYYLEKNNGKPFESYQYGICPKDDVVEICIEPNQVKAFEIILDKITIEKGFHRVTLPACIGCLFQESFREDKLFYSNEFLIK